MTKKSQYAPYGIGFEGNQFWVHVGSTTAPFAKVDHAVNYANRQFPHSAALIRNRDGKIVVRKEMGRHCVAPEGKS